MGRFQRNMQCLCGSGKKFKHCCGRSHGSASGAVATSGAPTIPAITIYPWAPRTQPPPDETHPVLDPALYPDFVIHGHFSIQSITTAFEYNEPLPGIGRRPLPEGYPGEYDVEYTLQLPSRLGVEGSNLNMDADMPGSSLLAIVKPEPRSATDALAMRSYVIPPGADLNDRSMWMAYDLIPNAEGFLATIKFHCYAPNSVMAERAAQTGMTGFLDRIAFAHDVPLHISRTRVFESATATTRVTFKHPPYLKVGFDSANPTMQGPVDIEKNRVLVFYHEALKASSPIYQYLCYFKVIELVLGLRTLRSIQAKAAGLDPRIEWEKLHSTAWLVKHVEDKELLRRLEGKKFTYVADLLKKTRHKVAHAFLDVEQTQQVDLNELEGEVLRNLPLAHYIARRLASAEAALPLDPDF